MIKNCKGFTLIELVAATAISILFCAAFFAAFFVMRNSFYQQAVFFNSNRAARFAMDYIARDAKEAIGVESSRGSDTTGNAVLILKLASIDANGEPTDFKTQFDYVVYKMDNANPTVLRRSLDVLDGVSSRNAGGDAANKEIARGIQSVLFSSGGTGLSAITNKAGLRTVNAQVTARGTTLRSTQTQTAQVDSDLLLRNKG